MRVIELFGYYFFWHYTRGFADVAGVYVNILWFLHHFFAIPRLLLSLLSPFRRMEDRMSGGFDLENFFGTLLVNIILRLIGAIVRLFTIVIGLVSIAVTLVAGLVFLALWAFLPLVAIGLFVMGVTMLASLL